MDAVTIGVENTHPVLRDRCHQITLNPCRAWRHLVAGVPVMAPPAGQPERSEAGWPLWCAAFAIAPERSDPTEVFLEIAEPKRIKSISVLATKYAAVSTVDVQRIKYALKLLCQGESFFGIQH